MRTFLPNLPLGGQSGCLADVEASHSVHVHLYSRKSITCLGAGLPISSMMRWLTLLGSPRGSTSLTGLFPRRCLHRVRLGPGPGGASVASGPPRVAWASSGPVPGGVFASGGWCVGVFVGC